MAEETTTPVNKTTMGAMMMGAFRRGPRQNAMQKSEQLLSSYNVERTELDSSARVKDLETNIAERVANRVQQLTKAERSGKTVSDEDRVNAFDEDEVTQFYVSELKGLVGDIGGMSRSMLKNQMKRMDVLMEGLADSSSDEKEFLMDEYSNSLRFLQAEYKKRSNIASRATAKMGDLAEQYMDVRSMYSGFVDDNPIAMALFRVAGDALSSYRENKKAQKELISSDLHRQFMAEKTEEDKVTALEREQERNKELAELEEKAIKQDRQVSPVSIPETDDDSMFSRESKVEGEAANEMMKVEGETDDRLDTEFRRESIERDERMFEKVSDIHDLLELGNEKKDENEEDVGLLAGIGNKFKGILKSAAPLLVMLAPLMKLGLVGLAGAAGYAAGTWIYEKFIEGTAFSEWLGESIHNIIEGTKQLWSDVANIFNNFGEHMSNIGDFVSSLVTDTFDSVKGVYNDLAKIIGDKVDAVKDLFSISDETKEKVAGWLDSSLNVLGLGDGAASDELANNVANNSMRNNNSIGIAGTVAPFNMTAANDSDGELQRMRQPHVLKDGNYVSAAELANASSKNNLDVPVQKAQEQKLNLIENQVSEIESEKERANVAIVGGQNLTPKSTKKSVQSTSGTQATTPLASARNPDSSIQRNTDRMVGRGMG